jgi:hypothetical protein
VLPEILAFSLPSTSQSTVKWAICGRGELVNAVTLELVDVLTFSASDQTAPLVSVLFDVFCFKL